MQQDGGSIQRLGKGRDGSTCIHRWLIKQAVKRLAASDRSREKKKKEKENTPRRSTRAPNR